ncbi:putative ribosomal protein L22 [Candidatus Carsonella ruddii CS isolate Thao2000]|uniref:Putative ribosomal protein L22 n=1 Tax=Candidatus Carsonella ruddii CS isolate Thao2000 TaxID=1202537 RepID=J7GTG2_CARRU|nr:hypothetical protein [Candidatus Carsonella ruddii]AFP83824.1 putative ribosomal protein L22 [Candidatus Carsonella ruddii CS isolate Thao2000]
MLKNKLNFLLPISFKKIFPYSKILSNKPILYYYTLFFYNKFNFYLKYIADTIINNFKNKNIFVINFCVGAKKICKKINYRAKGRVNFFIKKYSIITIKFKYGKKN